MTNGRGEPRFGADLEWRRWRELCGLLLDAGAVTEDDLDSTVDQNATKGQRLLNAIRAWGDAASNVRE